MRRGIAATLLVAATLAGCGVVQPSTTATARPDAPSPTPRQVTMADAERCPVTQPASGPPDVSPRSFFGWGSSYGNGELWVGGLWPDGVIAAGPEFVDKDGAIGMKFGWWRKVPGVLEITGSRLDAPGPPARGEVPSGYGETGFQASGVVFPTEGCWEVRGRVGPTTLTFVTFVVRQGT